MRAFVALSSLEWLVGIERSETLGVASATSESTDRLSLRSEDARAMSAFLEQGSVHKLVAVHLIYFFDPLADDARELHRILHPDSVGLLACKVDVIRAADKGIFVNSEQDAMVDGPRASGLSVRIEPGGVGAP